MSQQTAILVPGEYRPKAEPRTALTVGGKPRLAGLAGVVALGTGIAMIGPPPAVAASVGLPAAFRRTPALTQRAVEVAMLIPAVAAAPGPATAPGTGLPLPVGSGEMYRPALIQPVVLIPDNPSAPQFDSILAGGVTDSSAGAARFTASLNHETPANTPLLAAPAVTAPAGAALGPASATDPGVAAPAEGTAAPAPASAVTGDAAIVMAQAAPAAGPPPSGPPLSVPAPGTAPPAAPSGPVSYGVTQITGCVLRYCGIGAQTSDNNGNYNYVVGAGLNASFDPKKFLASGSITSGETDLYAPSMVNSLNVGFIGSPNFSYPGFSVRLTGQGEFPVGQMALYAASPLIASAKWLFPDTFSQYMPGSVQQYVPFTPPNVTLNVGGSVSLKGSAILLGAPAPDWVKSWLDTFQYQRAGYATWNSATGEWYTKDRWAVKGQIIGSDPSYLIGYVKWPGQTDYVSGAKDALTDLAKQAGTLISGDKAAQPTPAPTDQQPTDTTQPPATPSQDGSQPGGFKGGGGDTGGAGASGSWTPSTAAQPAVAGQQPEAPVGEQPPADASQQPPAGQPAPADTTQPTPTPSGQQPRTPVGEQPPADASQQPPAAAAQPAPADTSAPAPVGQQPPAPIGQLTPADSGQQPSAPAGQATSADTGQPPAAGAQPGPATRSIAAADSAYGQAGPGSVTEPTPVGAGLPDTGTATTGISSSAETTGSASTTASAGTTTADGTSLGTTTAGTTTSAAASAGSTTAPTASAGTTTAGTASAGSTTTAAASAGITTASAGSTTAATASAGSTTSAGTTSVGTTSTGSTASG